MQRRLLRDVYSEAAVNPSTVSFIELHGTGTVIGDMQESNSVADVFCSNGRSGPLLIGSVKSNMGHAEISSGLASLAKVIIAMHDHALPPNLHFSQPNPDIPALFDGRLKVISHNVTFLHRDAMLARCMLCLFVCLFVCPPKVCLSQHCILTSAVKYRMTHTMSDSFRLT